MTLTTSRWEEVLTGVDAYKGSILYLGEVLRRAKMDYQEIVGEGVNSWHDFLAQPEIGLSVREANSLISLVNLVDDYNLELEELNLATAKFVANKGIYSPELLEDMKVLSIKDWKERHHEVKTNDAPQTYTYMVMRRSKETGTLSRVYGVEDLEETIKQRVDEH